LTRDEGVIKFDLKWIEDKEGDAWRRPVHDLLSELIQFRQQLFAQNLVGVYPDGIGFGNISHRLAPGSPEFIISASQTGHVAQVSSDDFALVTKYDIARNWVECRGAKKASSESLTHAMIYDAFPDAQAVIHVHNNEAWQRLQGTVPTTASTVPYGTPAMAAEVVRLKDEAALGEAKFFVMSGHEDGIVSFGNDLESAYEALMKNV
jgi:L-ribulose-5-phosphate 4-epimerase